MTQQINRAAKEDLSRIWFGFTCDDVHHGGFTSAIGADDAAQLAWCYI